MMDFPISTAVNTPIHKKTFVEKSPMTPAMKKAFASGVEKIIWRNKLSATTLPVQPGRRVVEVEVFEVALKSASVNNQLLHSIDKSLHYHVLFLLQHGERYMASMGYKGSPEQTVREYFATAWMAYAELPLQIIGPTMDDVVDNFLRQIHQGLNDYDGVPLDDAIQALAWQKRQDNEIAKLEKLLRAEKQPKRKFELKQQITTIQNSTGDIHGQAEHAYAQRRGQEY
ncbi:DUF4391 domain-containing protein [Oligosphaera ethanolica]|uniref:Uncharacterized protein n=1 Tax=Oligosphaera ethanolica TaxID=760260 RepID=A0AAE3VKB0_9BACT|nr:DUF4391 domain-containing protein [Oligosphaera ethanolica]MDQ0291901.1 hypothetical protein [Oligosphaera ethanolica]